MQLRRVVVVIRRKANQQRLHPPVLLEQLREHGALRAAVGVVKAQPTHLPRNLQAVVLVVEGHARVAAVAHAQVAIGAQAACPGCRADGGAGPQRRRRSRHHLLHPMHLAQRRRRGGCRAQRDPCRRQRTPAGEYSPEPKLSPPLHLQQSRRSDPRQLSQRLDRAPVGIQERRDARALPGGLRSKRRRAAAMRAAGAATTLPRLEQVVGSRVGQQVADAIKKGVWRHFLLPNPRVPYLASVLSPPSTISWPAQPARPPPTSQAMRMSASHEARCWLASGGICAAPLPPSAARQTAALPNRRATPRSRSAYCSDATPRARQRGELGVRRLHGGEDERRREALQGAGTSRSRRRSRRPPPARTAARAARRGAQGRRERGLAARRAALPPPLRAHVEERGHLEHAAEGDAFDAGGGVLALRHSSSTAAASPRASRGAPRRWRLEPPRRRRAAARCDDDARLDEHLEEQLRERREGARMEQQPHRVCREAAVDVEAARAAHEALVCLGKAHALQQHIVLVGAHKRRDRERFGARRRAQQEEILQRRTAVLARHAVTYCSTIS